MSASAPDHAVRRAAEAVGLAAWAVAAVGWVVWCWRSGWAVGPPHLAAAAGLILALALLARRGWVRLFGPVLFYEALRAARRARFFLLRWLYAVGLLLLLLWVHWIWSLDRGAQVQGGATEQAYKQQARLAEQFFYAFAAVQFAAVVLLTPAYVAGGVAEEKERRTLEFLLATDLRGREIVFGKLLARVGNLSLFILTGLPVLSLMQFFGGIDPGLLLASFAITALTAASLAGLGILLSVQRRRARDAIILTYLAAAGYVTIVSACWLIPPALAEYRQATRQSRPAAVSATGQVPQPPDDEWVWDTVKWLNAGNPFSGLGQVIAAINSGTPPVADVVGEVVERYALVHGLFAVGCVALAVVRLRPVALAQAGAVPRKRTRFRITLTRRRPRVRQLPMLWKEVWIEGGLRFGVFGRILIALVVGFSFIPVVIIVYLEFFDSNLMAVNYRAAWDRLALEINPWVRIMTGLVSSLMLLGVAVRAAGAVGGERDRDTLVSLMTTPLTTPEIHWAKWVGSLLSVRLFAGWLAAVWLIGLVTGAVALPAVLLELVCWLCPAAFVAALGLFCSAVCKTTLRATSWVIFGTLVMLGGHWLAMAMCVYLPLTAAFSVSDKALEWVWQLEAGLTPPFVFGWLPFRDVTDLGSDGRFTALIAAAQAIWLVAAAMIGHFAHDAFRRLTNRTESYVRQGGPPVAKPQAVQEVG
jgi:ABC-type transport system involved in multi-copper enzyme maturation permease subunit